MNKARPSKNESGFSLIELLIVSVILVFIIGLIGGIVSNVQRSYSRQIPRTEAVNEATAALDMMTRLIQMAGNNPNEIGGLQPIDPGTPQNQIYQTIRIRSDWRGTNMNDAPDGDTNDPFEDVYFFALDNKLMRMDVSDTSAVEFLDNVYYLQFLYFDSNNALITNPVANTSDISRVEITIIMQPPNSTPMTFMSSSYLRQKSL